MRVYTAHEKPHAAPVLVREGFSLGALLFGPIWLAIQGAWIPAGAELLLTILFLLLPAPASLILIIGLAVLAGFSGRDLVRWSMAQSGYLESNIVTGRDDDDAHARLLEARPDLVERAMVAETAP
jgi:hypothetical protein